MGVCFASFLDISSCGVLSLTISVCHTLFSVVRQTSGWFLLEKLVLERAPVETTYWEETPSVLLSVSPQVTLIRTGY